MKQWIMNKNDADLKLMSKVLKIDIQIANILANRNIRTKNTAIKFLNPNLKFLYDTTLMKDIDKALEILSCTLKTKKKIVIYGDYDVDGVMSTVILFKTLSKLGFNVDFYLPLRTDDGFGLNINAINKIHDSGAKIILTCDNGIAAIDEIAYAKKLGMQIIIIDHHEPNNENGIDILPNADAIIDNKQKNCPYPFKFLCAAAMAYKFSKLLIEKNCENDSSPKHLQSNYLFLNDLLTFAAIATLCDIVPLVDENRIIAKCGIDLINNNEISNIGLICLLKQNKIYDKKINSTDVGFIIGPCINACGRLKSAKLAAKLFLSDNVEEAEELAFEICQLNEQRKILTRIACEETILKLQDYDLVKNPVIVYYNNEVDESIAGIIAGRIKEYFYHPVIFFTDSNNIIKGSARSIESYNIFNELQKCSDLFIKFGGHPMAAGISMDKTNLNLLTQRLNKNCQLSLDDFTAKIKIDANLSIDKINYEFVEKLMALGPFGHMNYEPIFISKNVRVEKINVIENKNTIIFLLKQNQKSIKSICFGLLDNFKEQLSNFYDNYESVKILNGFINDIDLYLDIVYSIEINEFNNNCSVQLRLKDFIINEGE